MSTNDHDEYQSIARHYDRVLEPLLARIRPAVTRVLVERLAPTRADRVLDLGCGPGRQALSLHEAGLDALGLDGSPAMLAQARKLLPPGFPLLLADATDLPLPDKSLDGVVVTLMLHEMGVDAAGRTLAEVRRVLRPNGTLAVVDYRNPDGLVSGMLMPLAGLVERMAGKRHFLAYKEFLQAGGAPRVLAEAGFACVSDRTFFGRTMGLFVCESVR